MNAARYTTLRRHESGVALLVTLWVLAILSIMVATYSLTVSTNTNLATNFTDELRAEGLARAGMEITIAKLMENKNQFTGYDELWQLHTNEDDGMTFEIGEYEVLVIDEASKLSVNLADEEQLAYLIEGDELRAAIVDWIDEDDEALPDGAESFFYGSESPAYTARNGPISTIGELGLVRNMGLEMLWGDPGLLGTRHRPDERRGLVDLLTVATIDSNLNAEGEARVNLNTASEEDLQTALSEQITEEQIQAIIAFRDSASREGQGGQQPGADSFNPDAMFQGGGTDFSVPSFLQGGGGEFAPPDLTTRQADTFSPNLDFGEVLGGAGMMDPQGGASGMQGTEGQPAAGGEGAEEPVAFSSLADLLSVEGFSADEVASIGDLVTTSDETLFVGRVNINTAPEEVLVAALDADENVIRDIIDYRESQGPFENIGQLLQLSGMEQETFSQIANDVTTRAYVYTIEAVGSVPESGLVKVLRCTVDVSGDRPNLLSYSEL